MKKLQATILAILAVVAVLFFLGFGIETGKSAPKHAIVLVDVKNGTYLAPPCVRHATEFNSLRTITIQQAEVEDLESDKECRNTGAFIQPARSLSGKLLEKLGVLQPTESRWNEDGSWNW